MIAPFEASDAAPEHDVCVVGSGPIGLATALALAARDLRVLVLEAGPADRPGPTPDHCVTDAHAPPDQCMSQNVGGASRLWGGRCVPLDDMDFRDWPIGPGALAPHQSEACRFFGLPDADFSLPFPLRLPDDIRLARLERWAPATNLAAAHGEALRSSKTILVLTQARLVELRFRAASADVEALTMEGPSGRANWRSPCVVLAAGAIETTRLLLVAQRTRPDLFGGRDGPLGRFYMGHLSGSIASLALGRADDFSEVDFFKEQASFARRRLTLSDRAMREHDLLNIAFWPDNPPFHAHEHGSGALSLVWLALRNPAIGRRLLPEPIRLSHVGGDAQPIAPHLRNILAAPLRTMSDAARIAAARLVGRPRRPGFLLRSADGVYRLHFHAEHAPHAESRIRLANRRDAAGAPLLDIDLRFGDGDVSSVLEAHRLLADALARSAWARLRFDFDADRRRDSVLAQARDGFHQIGTTRMGRDPARSVVDGDCRVHGSRNLFIASTSTFPTSGQANPTFTGVALAIRLAASLARTQRLQAGQGPLAA